MQFLLVLWLCHSFSMEFSSHLPFSTYLNFNVIPLASQISETSELAHSVILADKPARFKNLTMLLYIQKAISILTLYRFHMASFALQYGDCSNTNIFCFIIKSSYTLALLSLNGLMCACTMYAPYYWRKKWIFWQ